MDYLNAETVRKAQRLLHRFSYKPEFVTDVEELRLGDKPYKVYLKMTMVVEDSRRYADYRDIDLTTRLVAGQPRTLHAPVPIMLQVEIRPEHVAADTVFYSMLHEMITQLEDHERAEWFRVDGDLVNDPHAPRHSMRRALKGQPVG